MELVEDLWSKWSFKASIFFAAVWASVSAWWITLDDETRLSILNDLGLGNTTPSKLMAYVGLAAALAAGVTAGLRAVKQAPPGEAR